MVTQNSWLKHRGRATVNFRYEAAGSDLPRPFAESQVGSRSRSFMRSRIHLLVWGVKVQFLDQYRLWDSWSELPPPPPRSRRRLVAEWSFLIALALKKMQDTRADRHMGNRPVAPTSDRVGFK